jgi:hypothetical protein
MLGIVLVGCLGLVGLAAVLYVMVIRRGMATIKKLKDE